MEQEKKPTETPKKETTIARTPQENLARQLVNAAKDGFNAANSQLNFNTEAQFAIQIISQSEHLRKCPADSVRNAVVNVALTGITLNPALKLAYLVPRDGKCTLDISYMGMIEIALNTGIVKDINADVVCVNDEFDFEKGTSQFLRHKMAIKDRGEMIASYAIATLPNDTVHFEIITADEITKVKTTSKAAKSEYSPWQTWEGEMWKKTAVKRLFKYLKKELKPELLNTLDIERLNDESDYQQPKTNKFDDFEIVKE